MRPPWGQPVAVWVQDVTASGSPLGVHMTVSGSSAPLARRQQLIINETTQHIIVYDERSNHIHQLNATSAAVWRHCDGLHSVTDLQRLVSLDLGERVPMGSITLALAQLSDANLLEIPWVAASPPQRQSRRSLLRKTVITGAIAAPTLISISVPHAAAAQSCASGQSNCLGICCADGQCNAQGDCCGLGFLPCGSTCCPVGQECSGGNVCCPAGTTACGSGLCCDSSQVCVIESVGIFICGPRA